VIGAVAGLERIQGVGGAAEVLVARDARGVALAAADRICTWLNAAVHERGRAHIALTGGSSASLLAAELRLPRWRDAVPWNQVGVWWGDERFVPADRPESTFAEAVRDLLGPDGLPVPAANIHPFPVETALADGNGQEWVAEAYAAELSTMLSHRDHLPAFDVILLGMGPDGHVLSVFPGSEALDQGAPLVVAIPAPTHIAPMVPRITINPRLLAVAGHVLLMIPGAAKAATVSRVFTDPPDPRRLPAQLLLRDNATWLLDLGSAADLEAERVPLGAQRSGPEVR
jgi:6-phosphogluconolactonase